MQYEAREMEQAAVLQTAARMCAAARTAPKARGVDRIVTRVLTAEDKEKLAEKMEEIGRRIPEGQPNIFYRDAACLRAAQAVVLIGIEPNYPGVSQCGMCGFGACGACRAAGGRCGFDGINLGIALASAAEAAAQDRVDSRIMFSVGRAAAEMPYAGRAAMWHGIPISVTGKSIFFDRPTQA